MGVRIGIDTGGTFTDLVLLDETTGAVTVVKQPSTPDDPSRAIFTALENSKAILGDIGGFTLGTTVAVNALLQRRGARVLYITTAGFQDIPFLQRIDRKFHYDLEWERPRPLVKRRDCLGVVERVDYQGEIVDPLEPASLDKIVASVQARLSDLDGESAALAINFLFAYAHPKHEQVVRDRLRKEFPDLPISVSHEVAPIWREYERASTTIADAAVKPMMQTFVNSLDLGLKSRGFNRKWSVMKSNGGQMLAEAAADRPIQTVLSGLSGGIIAGKIIGDRQGDRNVITFDMGGTSTDVGVVANGSIGYTTAWEIEFGLPVSAPFIDLTTMGAGGGSIAWINRGGMLQVGPQSAGAVPGPACYGLGGDEPTVTDANVVLGRMNPKNFLGGDMSIDPDKAHHTIERLGRRLGLDGTAAALAILGVGVENIAEAMRLLTVRRGLDPRDYSIVAFGGAGPLHAAAIAELIAARAVIIPQHPGLVSALGALLADMRVDKTWTHILRSNQLSAPAVDARLKELEAEATADLRHEGYLGTPILQRSANMRYLGQNYEEEIEIPNGTISDGTLEEILLAFEDHYERAYGYRIQGEIVEIVQFNVTASGPSTPPATPTVVRGEPTRPIASRQIVFSSEGQLNCPIYDRSTLTPTDNIHGPAVIEELDSTTLVPTDWAFWVKDDGTGRMERHSS
jgi:N-methylhydantoinase A